METPIAIRREDKSHWERRAPLTPDHVRQLREQHGLAVYVQPSPIRVYREAEYAAAGATVQEDLSAACVVLAIKEIPPRLVQPDKTYLMFAHVIKGQAQNMPMLRRLMQQRCTLIDYEKVTDAGGRRLIFFGWHAGVVAMIESLWALGQRLGWEGVPNPFEDLRNTYTYDGLGAARDAVRAVGQRIATDGLPDAVSPLVVGVVGYGNVGRGITEILRDLPIVEVAASEVPRITADPAASSHVVYFATFRESDTVVPAVTGAAFELADYYQHPERYRPAFGPYLGHLTILMDANYWDARYPRLVTKDQIADLYGGGEQPRLRVIGDASCDIEGGIECTVLTTEPDEPVYVYHPESDAADLGVAGQGPVVLAVDILPSELPREASEYFGDILMPLLPAIASADYDLPTDRLALPPELLRGMILHRGQLTTPYRYLEQYLDH
jgi:saccharopine dehydrogenase (NAD+, L-lysine-forming)